MQKKEIIIFLFFAMPQYSAKDGVGAFWGSLPDSPERRRGV